MTRHSTPKSSARKRHRDETVADEFDEFDPPRPAHPRPISSHGQAQPAFEPQDGEDDQHRGRPSKSQLKRESTALQQLGEELLALPPGKLRNLPIPEQLIEAVELAHRISKTRGGLRRQRQFIGKLMREIDPQPLREALASDGARHRNEVATMHAAEHWRERLLQEVGGLDEFVAQYPEHSPIAVELERLIQTAKAEKAANQPGRRYRELYRQLFKALSEPPESSEPTEPLDSE